jgi:hypothetical protein
MPGLRPPTACRLRLRIDPFRARRLLDTSGAARDGEQFVIAKFGDVSSVAHRYVRRQPVGVLGGQPLGHKPFAYIYSLLRPPDVLVVQNALASLSNHPIFRSIVRYLYYLESPLLRFHHL